MLGSWRWRMIDDTPSGWHASDAHLSPSIQPSMLSLQCITTNVREKHQSSFVMLVCNHSPHVLFQVRHDCKEHVTSWIRWSSSQPASSSITYSISCSKDKIGRRFVSQLSWLGTWSPTGTGKKINWNKSSSHFRHFLTLLRSCTASSTSRLHSRWGLSRCHHQTFTAKLWELGNDQY